MATTTLPLLEDPPATKVARAVALVVLLVVTKAVVAPTLGAQVQALAQALRPDLDLDLAPQAPAKEEALVMEVPTTTAVEGLAAEAHKVMVLDPKAATAMAHLEMAHQDQVLETPPEMVADLAMTTMMLLATDHHQAQAAEAPLAMEEAGQVTMTITITPQTTVAQATLELEVLVAAKTEAVRDLLALRRILEALPMAARTTTTTRSMAALKEAKVLKATTWMTMKIAHRQDELPEVQHRLNRQSSERHLRPTSSHPVTQSSL